MKKMVRNLKSTILNKLKLHKSKAGYTLVEMIISFALVGILMASATTVLGSAYRTHLRINSLTKSHTVVDMLSETIEGELGAAKNTKVEGDYSIVVEPESVTYKDANGHKAMLYVNGDGYLCIKYPDAEIEGSTDEKYYGESTYLKNKITKIEFYHPEGTNYIKVELEVTDQVTNQRSSTKKVIECYNLTDDSFKK